MGSRSDDEGSQNERSPVTVQVQLKGERIAIQIELDQTVEDLKHALYGQTGILPDNQWLSHTGRILSNYETLRSYEMDLDKSVRLFHFGPAPPSTSTGSMPRESTPTPPTGTYELGPYKIHPRFINQDAIAKLMKNMPRLSYLGNFPRCWALTLETPKVLHIFLLYQLHRRVWTERVLNYDVTDNIESGYEVPKVAFMYYAPSGIPHGTDQNHFQLGLMGFSFVETSGKGSESSNANRSESAPNTEPLPNPWAASSNKGGSSSTEQGPDSILPDRGASSSQPEQVPDSDDELMDLSYWLKVHERSVDILVRNILSDATLLRHCKEQGRAAGRVYLPVVEAHDSCRMLNHGSLNCNMIDNFVCGCRDKYDSVINKLDMELGEYIRPILEKLYPIPYIVHYVQGASNDGGTGVTRNVAVPEEFFASQLADMEQMEFMDRRDNIIALLSSWGDVKKAVKWRTVRKIKSEVEGSEADASEEG